MKAKGFILTAALLFFVGLFNSTLRAESMVISNTNHVDNTIETTYFKGESETSLAPFKKVVRIQNEQGICVSEITYTWGERQKNWIPSEKVDYSYENDRIVKTDLSQWNKREMSWKYKESMSYDFDMQ